MRVRIALITYDLLLSEDQSTKEQLEVELKYQLHSLINQITVYTNATLEVTYNAGYLTNQTRALDYTPYGINARKHIPFKQRIGTI